MGDLVLVRNLSIRGKHKLADRWEEDPYRVVECIPGLPVYKVQDKDGKERVLYRNLLLPFRGPPSVPAASPQPIRPKQPLQLRRPTEDSCRDLEITEEDNDDEPYMELVPISASKPLNSEAADFRPPHVEMPAAVENPEADGDGMEKPLQTDSQQVHPHPVVPETDHQCDAGYPAVPNSVLPNLDLDEGPTEVTHYESGPDVEEADPVQDPPYVTRTGRKIKSPQRLICDPVWSQKASVLLSLANSQNQELLQNVFQNLLNCWNFVYWVVWLLERRNSFVRFHIVLFSLLTNVGTTFPQRGECVEELCRALLMYARRSRN